MKRELFVLRKEELMELLNDVEDQMPNLQPMPKESFLDGMRSGLNIARKICNLISYEAYEYDLHDEKANA